MILILCGKSASGKDTILNDLVKDKFVQKIISHTTRPKRGNESNGVDYFFVSDEYFKDMMNQGKFFQTREYKTCVAGKEDIWYYGSARVDPTKVNYGTIVDIQGAKDYIKEYGKENVYVVYVDASDATREKRARHRPSFDQTEWDRRLKDDNEKFNLMEIRKLADLVVSNEEDIRDAKFEICYGFYNYVVDHKQNSIQIRKDI